MRVLGGTRVLIAAFGLFVSQSLAWGAPDTTPNPSAAPPAGTAEQNQNFVPPRAIPSSAMKNWPVYPAAARQAHRVGVVLLSVRISAQGAPLDVKVAKSSTFQDLDFAAVTAVRNWQFTPATREGTATETTVNLPINFSLKAPEQPAPAAAAADPAKPQPAQAQVQAQEKPKQKPKVAQKPAPKPKAKPATPKPDASAPANAAEPEEPAKEAN